MGSGDDVFELGFGCQEWFDFAVEDEAEVVEDLEVVGVVDGDAHFAAGLAHAQDEVFFHDAFVDGVFVDEFGYFFVGEIDIFDAMLDREGFEDLVV